jgi:hypothetical protein
MSFRKMPYWLLMVVIGLFALSACSENSSSGQPTTMTSVTELPSAVLILPFGQLRAYISIDGGARIELGINNNTATGEIPGLSRAVHNVLIEFEFTDSSNNTFTVATASRDVDLSSGDASISFSDTDYDLDSYDDDGDGISNAAELAALANTECVLGSSLIGSCTL